MTLCSIYIHTVAIKNCGRMIDLAPMLQATSGDGQKLIHLTAQ